MTWLWVSLIILGVLDFYARLKSIKDELEKINITLDQIKERLEDIQSSTDEIKYEVTPNDNSWDAIL